jgi:hypothetical protein
VAVAGVVIPALEDEVALTVVAAAVIVADIVVEAIFAEDEAVATFVEGAVAVIFVDEVALGVDEAAAQVSMNRPGGYHACLPFDPTLTLFFAGYSTRDLPTLTRVCSTTRRMLWCNPCSLSV